MIYITDRFKYFRGLLRDFDINHYIYIHKMSFLMSSYQRLREQYQDNWCSTQYLEDLRLAWLHHRMDETAIVNTRRTGPGIVDTNQYRSNTPNFAYIYDAGAYDLPPGSTLIDQFTPDIESIQLQVAMSLAITGMSWQTQPVYWWRPRVPRYWRYLQRRPC